MATSTLGTNATTSIPLAMAFIASAINAADFASLNNAIADDSNPAHPTYKQGLQSGGFNKEGLLYIPSRGVLKVLPGDWVGVDSRGWPILLSADTIANGAWTHS